jgi:type IV secretory pathway TrbD component
VPPVGSAPPVGEEIHLPGPSLIPVVTALGISIALVGVVLSLWLALVGVLITVVAVARWIADTRRDISELPLEHH